jgi:hypothetical protein
MREPPSLAEFFGQRGSNTSGIGTFLTRRDIRVESVVRSRAEIIAPIVRQSVVMKNQGLLGPASSGRTFFFLNMHRLNAWFVGVLFDLWRPEK